MAAAIMTIIRIAKRAMIRHLLELLMWTRQKTVQEEDESCVGDDVERYDGSVECILGAY